MTKNKPKRKDKDKSTPGSTQPELLDVDQLLSIDVDALAADAALTPAPAPTPGEHAANQPAARQQNGKPEKSKMRKSLKRAAAEASATMTTSKLSKSAARKGGKVREVASDDEAEQDPLRDSVSGHQADLDALRERDPEFYEYLKESDGDLLAFGDGMDLSDSDHEAPQASDDDGDQAAAKPSKKDKKATKAISKDETTAAHDSGGLRVTEDVAVRCCEAAKASASMGTVHQLVKVYRAACHYSDSEQETEMALQITSSRAFNKIMLFTLAEADGLLRRMLGNVDQAADKATDVTQQPRWRKVEPLAKSYLGNTLHLLGSMTDAGMQAFILRRLRASAVFLRPFEKLTRKLLKAALGLFGLAGDRSVHTQAILFIRQLALVLPQPALDDCLKGVTRTFAAYSKFSNASSVAHLGFMATCIVELFSLDESASYAHAFTAIKDLAVTLRGALNMKTADAFRSVYCWQTVRCLELWARVLTELGPQSELRALVYPLVQVLLGAARLVPAPRYFPLRLRIAAALQRLADSAGVLVPLAPLLLEMLTWADLAKPPQTAAGQAPDLHTALRVSKSALRTASFQEDVVIQVLQLLAAHLAQWATSVAAPELAHLPTLQLKALAKSLPAERFRSQVKALLAAIERNSAWVGRQRDAVEFSPKDLSSCEAFLSKERAARQAPLQQYADLLTRRLQALQEMRTAERLTVPRSGGRHPQHSGEPDDGIVEEDDGVEEARAPRLLHQRRQPHAPQKPGASQGNAMTLAQLSAADDSTDAVADYVLSDDEGDDMLPPGHRLFGSGRATAGGHASDGDNDDDVMGGDFDSDEDNGAGASPTEPRQKLQSRPPGKAKGAAGQKKHKGGKSPGGGGGGGKGKGKAKQRHEHKASRKR